MVTIPLLEAPLFLLHKILMPLDFFVTDIHLLLLDTVHLPIALTVILV